jgi:hypothetical protein
MKSVLVSSTIFILGLSSHATTLTCSGDRVNVSARIVTAGAEKVALSDVFVILFDDRGDQDGELSMGMVTSHPSTGASQFNERFPFEFKKGQQSLNLGIKSGRQLFPGSKIFGAYSNKEIDTDLECEVELE